MDTTKDIQGETDHDIEVDTLVDICRHKEVEKELPTCDPDEDIPQNSDLENIFDGPWDRDWDQFQINETLFGKKSNFDEELYTNKFVRGPEMGQLEKDAMKRAGEIQCEEFQDLHLAEGRGIDIFDIDKETRFLSVSPRPHKSIIDNTGDEEKEDIGLDSRNAETVGAFDSPSGRCTELSGGDSNDGAKISFGSSSVGLPQSFPSSAEVDLSQSCRIDHAKQLASEVTFKSPAAVDVESRIQEDSASKQQDSNTTIRENNKQVEEMPTPKSGEVEKELAIDEDVPQKELAIDEDIPQSPQLENIFGGVWDRGWDQFDINESLFGVKSKFNDQFYTTKLVRGPEMRHLEKKAIRRERKIDCKETQGLHLAEEKGIDIRANLNIDEETQVSSVPRGKSLDKNQSEDEEDIPLDSRNTELSGGKSDDVAKIHSSSSPVERGIDMSENFDIDKEIQASSVSRGKSLGISDCIKEEDTPLDSRIAETIDAYVPSGRSTQWSGGKSNDGANISSCSSPMKSVIHEGINDRETQFTLVSRKSRKARPSSGAYGTHSPRSFDMSAGKNNDGSRISSSSSLVRRGITHGKFDNQGSQFSSRGASHLANTLAGGYGTNSPRSTSSLRSTALSGGKINNGAKIASGSSSVGSLSSLNLKKDSSDKELLCNVAAPTSASHVLPKNEWETVSTPLIEAPPSKAAYGEPDVLISIGRSDPPESSGASSSAAMSAASSERFTLNPNAQGSLSSQNIKKDSSYKEELCNVAAPTTDSHVLPKNEGETFSTPLIEAPPSKTSHEEPEVLTSIGRSDPSASSCASSSAAVGAASSERFTLNPNAQEFEFNPNANRSTPFAGNQSVVFNNQFSQMQPSRQIYYPPLYAQAIAQQMQLPPQSFYPPLPQFQQMQPPPQAYSLFFQVPLMQSPTQGYVPAPAQYWHRSVSSTGSQPVEMCYLGGFQPPPSPPCPSQPAPQYYSGPG